MKMFVIAKPFLIELIITIQTYVSLTLLISPSLCLL